MKAVKIKKIGMLPDLVDVPVPTLTGNNVLIKVRATCLSTSDLNYALGKTPVATEGVTLGYGAAGMVEKLGSNVEQILLNQKVCIYPIISCRTCDQCNKNRDNLCNQMNIMGIDYDGALAEYVTIPVNNIQLLPDTISFEEGALLAEPVAIALHAINQIHLEGANVAIFGSGFVGIHIVQLARLKGADKIIVIDKIKHRLSAALNVGATAVINFQTKNPITQLKKITNNQGIDVAFEASGNSEAATQSIECLGKGGKMILIGLITNPLQINLLDFVLNENQIISSIDYTPHDLKNAIKLACSGKLSVKNLITHRLQLQEIQTGFEIIRKNKHLNLIIIQ